MTSQAPFEQKAAEAEREREEAEPERALTIAQAIVDEAERQGAGDLSMDELGASAPSGSRFSPQTHRIYRFRTEASTSSSAGSA